MSRSARKTVLLLALLALLGAVPAAIAAFAATTSNSANSFAAAATFNDTLQMATGGYTGDAVNGRTIAVGFQPDYVIVKANGAQIGVARTSTMPVDYSKPMTGSTSLLPLRIRSFTGTGFTIGTDASVNTNLAAYSWVAFKARPGVMKVGSYPGTGTAQSPATTFSPDHVSVFGEGITRPVQRFTGMTTTFRYESSTGTASAINSLDPTGFTVGTAAETNAATSPALTYHYVAFNEVSGAVKRGSYVGNNTSNRPITGLGFQPGYVNIRANDTATAREGHHRPASVSGTGSQFFSALANSTTAITALGADGFTLGTNGAVNASGPTYHYMAFKNTGG